MRRYLMPAFLILFLISNMCAQSLVDVKRYEATIRLNIDSRLLVAEAGLELTNISGAALDTIPLHLRDLTVSSVLVNGNAAAWRHTGDQLLIVPSTPLEYNSGATVHVVYSGDPTHEPGSSFGGFFWGDPTYTIGVSFRTPYVSMTRHWLPSNDIPSDKATFDLKFIVPAGIVVAGTGKLKSVNALGKDSLVYRWVENHPTATYLVTLAAGSYARIRDTWNNLPLEYYVPRKDSLKGLSYFSTIPSMLECFEHYFGPYAFDKVGYCITPIGAMEHQTMISFPANLFAFQPKASTTAAHELAHQWWGDWVTPEDFREAWLSEGFATFGEALYAGWLKGRAAYLQQHHQNISDYVFGIAQREGIFPLYDFPRTPPSSNYPVTIYKKGAVVLGMLRHIVGDTAFFRGLKEYGKRHAYGNATTHDFRRSMEDAWGQDLGWFFDEWVYKAGFPFYVVERRINTSQEDAPEVLRIHQTQDTTVSPLFLMPADILIIKTNGDTLRYVINIRPEAVQDFTFPDVKQKHVASIIFDPLGIILKRVRYRTLEAEEPESAPPNVVLGALYPNPVSTTHEGRSPLVTIPFEIDRPARIQIDLFDSLGRRVRRLIDSRYSSGSFSVSTDVSNVGAGTYYILLSSPNSRQVRRMIVTGR